MTAYDCVDGGHQALVLWYINNAVRLEDPTCSDSHWAPIRPRTVRLLSCQNLLWESGGEPWLHHWSVCSSKRTVNAQPQLRYQLRSARVWAQHTELSDKRQTETGCRWGGFISSVSRGLVNRLLPSHWSSICLLSVCLLSSPYMLPF